MLGVFDNDSIRRTLQVRHRDCKPAALPRLMCRPALLVQRRLGHTAGRSDQGPPYAHNAVHVTQANRRPFEDMSNHDQGIHGTPLRSTRGRKFLVSTNRVAEPRVPLSRHGQLNWRYRLNARWVNTVQEQISLEAMALTCLL